MSVISGGRNGHNGFFWERMTGLGAEKRGFSFYMYIHTYTHTHMHIHTYII